MRVVHFPSHEESQGQRCAKTMLTCKCPVHVVTLGRKPFMKALIVVITLPPQTHCATRSSFFSCKAILPVRQI